MKLQHWLERENVTCAEFGTRINRTGEAIRRYAAGLRIPDRETMPKIVDATFGEVTANDFFNLDPSLVSSDGNISSEGRASPGNIGEISHEAVR